MKLSKAVKAHLADAEENVGKAFADIQCAFDCLSGNVQKSELGETISDLMDSAETLSGQLSKLLTDESK